MAEKDTYIQIIVYRDKYPYMLLYPTNKMNPRKRRKLEISSKGEIKGILDKEDADIFKDEYKDGLILIDDCIRPTADNLHSFDVSEYKIVETFITKEVD